MLTPPASEQELVSLVAGVHAIPSPLGEERIHPPSPFQRSHGVDQMQVIGFAVMQDRDAEQMCVSLSSGDLCSSLVMAWRHSHGPMQQSGSLL